MNFMVQFRCEVEVMTERRFEMQIQELGIFY